MKKTIFLLALASTLLVGNAVAEVNWTLGGGPAWQELGVDFDSPTFYQDLMGIISSPAMPAGDDDGKKWPDPYIRRDLTGVSSGDDDVFPMGGYVTLTGLCNDGPWGIELGFEFIPFDAKSNGSFSYTETYKAFPWSCPETTEYTGSIKQRLEGWFYALDLGPTYQKKSGDWTFFASAGGSLLWADGTYKESATTQGITVSGKDSGSDYGFGAYAKLGVNYDINTNWAVGGFAGYRFLCQELDLGSATLDPEGWVLAAQVVYKF